MPRFAAWLCFMAAAAGGGANAMGPLEAWAGGTLRLMADQPAISMTSQRLLLEPQATTTLVTVHTQLHNHGDACTAEIGFPMLKYEGVDGYHVLTDFAVDVNGEPLAFTQAEETRNITLGEEERECEWYLFSVPFGAGQTREVRVRYDERRMFHPYHELRLPFILATGAGWRGAVRDLQAEVRLGDRENFHNLELKGDEEPLPVSERGEALVWGAAEYDGQPEVLWFTATFGPKSLKRDDGAWTAEGCDCVRWRRGVLLVEADLLCDLLLAESKRHAFGGLGIEKEGQEVPLEGWQLPLAEAPQSRLFVDPRPAFRQFGGGIEVTRDDAGDVAVEIAALPDSADSARATAYFLRQKTEYRLRCLEALANRWPEGLADLYEQTVGRQALDDPSVLVWALGHLAESAPEPPDAAKFVSRMRFGDDADPVAELADIIVSTSYDTVVRGGGMALAQLDPEAATVELLRAIPRYTIWWEGRHRARRAGLAMRLAGDPQAAQVVMSLIDDYGETDEAENAMRALGFLGDDAAIEFLVETALALRERSHDMNCAAAQALSVIGTPAALAACADVWQRTSSSEVRSRARRGFEFAMGDPGVAGALFLRPPPEWARQMSVEDGCRVSLPLLEGLMPKAEEIGREGGLASLIERTRKKLAEFEAAAGG
jgi:hypothetical protein